MSSTIAGKQNIVPTHRVPARSTAFWSSINKFDRILDNLSNREFFIFQRIVDSTKHNDLRTSKLLARELTYSKLVRARLEHTKSMMVLDAKKYLNYN